ncbi:MAG TPA: peptidoglycan-binding protein [Thermoleophilaceae bacterium]|nr:peptidoglycan-binding protein [Thermoleophilaceae bacterium]
MPTDLSAPDLWEASLERSRERRAALALARRRERARGRRRALATAAPLGTLLLVVTAMAGGGDEPLPAKPRTERTEAPAPAARSAPAKHVEAQPAHAEKPRRTRAAIPRKRPGGVRMLQAALGVPVDGAMGVQTTRALRRWQRAHGLEVDGVAGPATRAALGLGPGPALKAPPRARPAKRARRRATVGAASRRGGGVRALQRALGVPADGVFGPGTARTLRRWQRARGLTADGIAGPTTRSALGLGPGPVLKPRRAKRRGRSGGMPDAVRRVIAAGNRIATKPYRYGGGHGSFEDSGYDCSGSVSYALHGGGLLSSPLSSSGLMSWGAPGPGRWITVYANPGHTYMVVAGRRFDTTARNENGTRWTAAQRSAATYSVRHPPGL